jgi:hypothetical protein
MAKFIGRYLAKPRLVQGLSGWDHNADQKSEKLVTLTEWFRASRELAVDSSRRQVVPEEIAAA